MDARSAIGSFRPGEYVRLDGRIVGELSPASEAIPDLDKAPRNARGMVEYSAKLVIVMPTDPAKGNGALLIDIPNRGRPISHSLYNSPRDVPIPLGPIADPGTGFLEDQGYSIAIPFWELGQGAELPSFTGPDGKPLYIEGVGFAIVRDTADFLANAPVDSAGQANPLAGNVSRTLALGYSQTGRFLRTALFHGFNMVEGRRVFAGMHIFAAGGNHLPILHSTTGPESTAGSIPTFANPEIRGIAEEPLATAAIVEQVRSRNEIPPKIFVVNTTTDYKSVRASLGRTGSGRMEDLPLPDDVRMYDIAGASHALVRSADCKLPVAVLDWHPVMRATLLALDEWVSGNVEPPASRLMPLKARGDDATILPPPSYLPNATIQVPMSDPDGNAMGGVRLPILSRR
jgi:Alpha/beta hydrolase domain